MKRISELPFDERPRKNGCLGVASLSDASAGYFAAYRVEGESAVELGAHLLDEFHGIAGIHAAEIDQLCVLNGSGRQKTPSQAGAGTGSRLHRDRWMSAGNRQPEKAYEVLKFEIIQNDRETLWCWH
jgi:DNA repair protein RadC